MASPTLYSAAPLQGQSPGTAGGSMAMDGRDPRAPPRPPCHARPQLPPAWGDQGHSVAAPPQRPSATSRRQLAWDRPIRTSSTPCCPPVSSALRWLRSYACRGHPSGRCSWSRAGSRSEHLLLPTAASPTAGRAPASARPHGPTRPALAATTSFSASPSPRVTRAATNSARIGFWGGWRTAFPPRRVTPSSPMGKSIAQKLKSVWIHSASTAPGLSCDLLYSQAITHWKLLLYSVSEYISSIIVFSICTWSENLYYLTTKYKMHSENHQIWMLKVCFLSIMAFPVQR